MRLIDADALITTMQNYYEYSGRLCDELANIIDHAPTIEGAPVVRCTDCIHWNSETKDCKRNPSVEEWGETDFCSYGERREP